MRIPIANNLSIPLRDSYSGSARPSVGYRVFQAFSFSDHHHRRRRRRLWEQREEDESVI